MCFWVSYGKVLVGWDQAPGSCYLNSPTPAVNAEFLIEIDRMALHSRRGNEQLCGDLLVAVALCQQI